MQVDLDFSISGCTVMRQLVKQRRLILLRGIEKGTLQSSTVTIAPRLNCFRIFSNPIIQPLLLFRELSTSTW
jgi:hypothetical protein